MQVKMSIISQENIISQEVDLVETIDSSLL